MRSKVLVVAGIVILAVLGGWLLRDGSAGAWLRALFSGKPAIQIDFARLTGDEPRAAALARFPGLKPACRADAAVTGEEECVAAVASVNSVTATSLILIFENDRLAQLRVLLPGAGHRALLTELRDKHGSWNLLDRPDAHAVQRVGWSFAGGRLVMAEEVGQAPEATVEWTSKARLFRDIVREIGGLIQSERAQHHVVAQVQVQPGGRERNYDTASGFRFSFKRARLVSPEFNAELSEWIKANAETVPSPLMLELAQRQYYSDAREAMKWYATFRLLVAYDAARCSDPTAARGSGVTSVLVLYPLLTRHAEQHPEQVREGMAAARDWARSRQVRSSPMWLCATGMRAVRLIERGQPAPVPVSELLVPEHDWPAAWRNALQTGGGR